MLSRMAIFGTSKQPGTAQTLKATELAADAFGVQVLYQDVREPNDIDGGFQAARKARADAALVLSSAVFFSQRARIADLAVKNRLPIIFPQNEFVEDGGLMSYAPNYADLFRRAATYWIRFSGARSPRTCP